MVAFLTEQDASVKIGLDIALVEPERVIVQRERRIRLLGGNRVGKVGVSAGCFRRFADHCREQGFVVPPDSGTHHRIGTEKHDDHRQRGSGQSPRKLPESEQARERRYQDHHDTGRREAEQAFSGQRADRGDTRHRQQKGDRPGISPKRCRELALERKERDRNDKEQGGDDVRGRDKERVIGRILGAVLERPEEHLDV